MAQIERLVETKELDMTRLVEQLEKGHVASVRFDEYVDMLVVYLVPCGSAETVVHYVDDFVGLIYTPENMEVVGFQVEAFKRGFLPAHEPVNKAWKLSESGIDLGEDAELADLIMIVEKKKIDVARGVAESVNDDLFGQAYRQRRQPTYA